ncbi:hypothetical protein MSG28_013406 [Choristoneura fumiferana]|uniref:Uncharacterized protein n=1 Tax=Choristoneura fumiferana TaxID=7141 RepID=A0ACC0KU47_CHOFU|nr:hypothetical protein MSG28_013406 [Choristoneura fumiferana]
MGKPKLNKSQEKRGRSERSLSALRMGGGGARGTREAQETAGKRGLAYLPTLIIWTRVLPYRADSRAGCDGATRLPSAVLRATRHIPHCDAVLLS